MSGRCPFHRILAVAVLTALAPISLARSETTAEARLPAADAAPRAVVKTLRLGDVERTYRLYVPTSRNGRGPIPLVIVLHGARGDSEQAERYLGLNAVADREGLAVAYPQGDGSVWNDGRPRELTTLGVEVTADDVGFLLALASQLAASGIADDGRIFVAGISEGGFMAARLACEAPGMFAGFAFLLAGAPRSHRAGCRPSRPLPVMILNGTEDRLMPWEGIVPPGLPREGEIGIMPVAEHVAHWVERNGCRSSVETRLVDRDPADGTSIVRTEWAGCAAGSAVTFYAVEGGGHQTPSPRVGLVDHVIAAFLGVRSRDAETSELLWEFFNLFKR